MTTNKDYQPERIATVERAEFGVDYLTAKAIRQPLGAIIDEVGVWGLAINEGFVEAATDLCERCDNILEGTEVED